MKCPNCEDIELEDFCSGKDFEVSNTDTEINLGRFHILCCPECRYVDQRSIWFT